jgi:hypothetical protein
MATGVGAFQNSTTGGLNTADGQTRSTSPFSLRDLLWRRDLGANGKIQKEQEQTEAQPDGA